MDSGAVPIPLHLSIYEPYMGTKNTASVLMFEHTRLFIRTIAFLYQIIRSKMYENNGLPTKVLFNSDEIGYLLYKSKKDLEQQINFWKPKILEIAKNVREYSENEQLFQADRLISDLKQHTEIVYDYAEKLLKTHYLTDADIEYYDRLEPILETNSHFIAEVMHNITGSKWGNFEKFETLWKDHIKCTYDYILAATISDEEFDKKASECLRRTVLLGAALDDPLYYALYPTGEIRRSGESISSEDNTYL